MVLKKLSKTMAAAATAAMMIGSPMMAMAANSPVVPTVEKLVADGLATATFDEETGALTSLTVVGNTDDGVLPVDIDGTVVYLVIKGGQWDNAFTSKQGDDVVTVTVDGDQFIVDKGVVMTWVNGIVTYDEAAYFVAAGKVVTAETVAEYQGEWFAIKGGKVDTSVTGPKTFKDAKGNDVTGLFAAGRLIKEFSGFTTDTTGTMYFVEEGVIRTDLSGEVEGKLEDGTVAKATIKNGVVVK